MEKEIKQAVWLSHQAYFDPEKIQANLMYRGFRNFEWIDNKYSDTQVILCTSKKNMFVIFRGTEVKNIKDWLTNLNCKFSPIIPWGEVHRGFYKDVESVYDEIQTYLVWHNLSKVVIGGHSQGAACATVFSAITPAFDAVVLPGCPRIFDNKAAKRFGEIHGHKVYRIVNNNDLVTRLPPRTWGYRHIEKANLYYFKETGECVHEISEWEVFKDRIHGRILDIGEGGTDGIKDHDHAYYVELVESLKNN